MSVGHVGDLCKIGQTDRGAVYGVNSSNPKEPCIRWGTDPPGKRAVLRACNLVLPLLKPLIILMSNIIKNEPISVWHGRSVSVTECSLSL